MAIGSDPNWLIVIVKKIHHTKKEEVLTRLLNVQLCSSQVNKGKSYGTGWFLVMGQYGSVLVGTWWYCVSIGWYWLIYDGTESEKGSTG